METAITFFTALVALAFLVESMTEYIFAPLSALKPVIPYVALAVGIAIAVFYRLDILLTLFKLSTDVPFVGYVITGLVLGRGSSFLHDFYTSYVKPEPKP